MNSAPLSACSEVLFSERVSAFRCENNVDIVGVTSSILVTPTILLLEIIGFFGDFVLGARSSRRVQRTCAAENEPPLLRETGFPDTSAMPVPLCQNRDRALKIGVKP
jgi:hypothetical protein